MQAPSPPCHCPAQAHALYAGLRRFSRRCPAGYINRQDYPTTLSAVCILGKSPVSYWGFPQVVFEAAA